MSVDREYRIHVLATLKAVAWLSFPIVFALMAWWGVGEGIAGWAQRGFLKGDAWGFVLSPIMWAALAALIGAAIYSTLIKYAWGAWDHRAKYPCEGEGRTDA